MKKKYVLLLVAVAVLGSALLPALSLGAAFFIGKYAPTGPPLPTMQIEEDASYFLGKVGTFLDYAPGKGLLVYRAGEAPEVLPTRRIMGVTGPARNGLAAYLESSQFSCRVMLRNIDRPEEEPEVLAKSGCTCFSLCTEWSHLAIDPSGQYLALLSMGEGLVSFMTLDATRSTTEGPRSVRSPLFWFPGSDRVGFERGIGFDDASARDAPGDYLSSRRDNGWKAISAVYSYVISSGEEEFLCYGSNPVLSTSGKALVVERMPGEWILVNLDNKDETRLDIPGIHGRVYGLIDDKIIAYDGLPTEGAVQLWWRRPLKLPTPMWTFKLWNMSNDKIATLGTRGPANTRISGGVRD